MPSLLALTLWVSLAGIPSRGDGHWGTLEVDAGTVTLNPSAPLRAAVPAGSSTLPVVAADVSGRGIQLGDLVLIVQTQARFDAGSGEVLPIALDAVGVGHFEFTRVTGIDASSLRLFEPLGLGYTFPGAQLVVIPEFASVRIGAGAQVVAPAWDGGSGGVVGFFSRGLVELDGVISATGTGFRGGTRLDTRPTPSGCTGLDEPAPNGGAKGEGISAEQYGRTGRGNVANAAGGGVCQSSGGGGGANRGAGGSGGVSAQADGSRPVGGLGGAELVFTPPARVSFGGGGGTPSNGATSAASGGGLVFIRAGALVGVGTLEARGASAADIAADDAASGGGAGGTIVVQVRGTLTCSLATAEGGRGGSTGVTAAGEPLAPGGGGGGGVVFLAGATAGCNALAASGLAGASDAGADLRATPTDAGVNDGLVIEQRDGGFDPIPRPVITAPKTGQRLKVEPVTLAGTGEALTEVLVFLDGELAVTAQVNSNSFWSVTLPAPSLGPHVIVARLRDLTGAVSPDSVPVRIEVASEAHPLVVGCGCGSEPGLAAALLTTLLLLGRRRRP